MPVTVGVGALAVIPGGEMRQGSERTRTLTNRFLPELASLARLQPAALNLKSVTLQFALAKDEAGMNARKQIFQTESQDDRRSLAELKARAGGAKTTALIAGRFAGQT